MKRACFAALLSMGVIAQFAAAGPAAANVNYADHNIFSNPSGWNGYKVYISPGHKSNDQNNFPCGSISTSEWTEAWKTAWNVRDKLVNDWFYKVMMPKKDLDVPLEDRVDTAHDWDSDGVPFAYVPIHSNAGHSEGCSHAHSGTQLLKENDKDDNLGTKIYWRVADDTPGTTGQHETEVANFCSIRWIYELCSDKALLLPTGYIEVEFHDTNQGANYIHNNNSPTGLSIARGIDCFLGVWGDTCG